MVTPITTMAASPNVKSRGTTSFFLGYWEAGALARASLPDSFTVLKCQPGLRQPK
jgi:hypothetical protein